MCQQSMVRHTEDHEQKSTDQLLDIVILKADLNEVR
jgi:hypothetical protein